MPCVAAWSRQFDDVLPNMIYENHDIAIAMSSSRADPLLGLNIYPPALAGGI